MTALRAVLTGDLVKSSSLSDDEMRQARDALAEAARDMNGASWAKGRVVRGKPDWFRGDAWQLLLTETRWALRAAILVRASLLARAGVSTRVSIGLGTVERLSRSRVSLSRGEAFTLSGHGLDEMGARHRMTLTASDEAGAVGEWLDVATRLCDSLVEQWQRRQVEVVRARLLLREATLVEIGESLDPPAVVQVVSRSLQGAGWAGVEYALERFESRDSASKS